jgi:hypothetical protein
VPSGKKLIIRTSQQGGSSVVFGYANQAADRDGVLRSTLTGVVMQADEYVTYGVEDIVDFEVPAGKYPFIGVPPTTGGGRAAKMLCELIDV